MNHGFELRRGFIAAKAYSRPYSGCLRFADAIMSPSPGLLAMALSKPVPVREDDLGPVYISVGGQAPT